MSDITTLAEQHRRELHVHCYRMLASFDDAEDAVQETVIRAWKHADEVEAGPLFRAWLYKVATNVCLDMLRARSRRLPEMRTFAEIPWLQPYPDRLLDRASEPEAVPDEIVIERETIELAVIAAMQLLPPRQRAALILRDVMGWPAADTAQLLEMSVAAANSALQRARATMQQHLPARRAEWTTRAITDEERTMLDRFIDAHERCDAAAAAAMMADDIRVTMPPNPMVFDGSARVSELLERAFGPERDGDWRLLPTACNRMPAAASYLRRPGDTAFRGLKTDVLRIENGRIAEITTFGYAMFPHYGLPLVLGA